MNKLDVDLSDPGGLPEQAIDQAVALMRTGRLHRYGEYGGAEPHVALLETEFAEYVGARYAVGVNSGGCAIFIALKAAGVGPNDNVLVNAFNLAPVPGAIYHAGANPVLVEVGADFCINVADLRDKAKQSGAKTLLLTHMRGHIADMGEITQVCDELGLTLVEDCAHTMGASWREKFTGRFGAVGCFSTQTFKHINSGEGGILVTDDDDIAAKAILYTGSYMLYGQHQSAPPLSVFEKWRTQIPNCSMRMSNLVACVLRPQLREMKLRGEKWNALYEALASRFNQIDGISVPSRVENEHYVASSIQFNVHGLNYNQIEQWVESCTSKGVAIKWFGRDEPMGYTSLYQHWGYVDSQPMPQTEAVLSNTCDMRIPLSLTDAQCETIADVMRTELDATLGR